MRKTMGLCSKALAIVAAIASFSGCQKSAAPSADGAIPPPLPTEPLLVQARSLFKAIPESSPALPGNNATPEKVALGQMLYFDPRLSASHAISCASCHNLSLGGTDIASTSLGHRSQIGGRNSPTVLNAVFNTAQFWDGRAADLQQQAGGPLVNPVEMASPKDHVVEQLKGIPGYQAVFTAAFPGESDPITFDNVEKAVAVFEATLLTPGAPFDRYLGGEIDALSATEKEGLKLFIDKGCASCHNGINVGGGMYAPFGVVEKPNAKLLPPGDKGRFAVTKSAGDQYVYKVPTLRNVAITLPYFHTGQVWDLREAIEVMGTVQLGSQLAPDETEKIAVFLGTLTGRPPAITLPTLPPSAATTPQPQP